MQPTPNNTHSNSSYNHRIVSNTPQFHRMQPHSHSASPGGMPSMLRTFSAFPEVHHSIEHHPAIRNSSPIPVSPQSRRIATSSKFAAASLSSGSSVLPAPISTTSSSPHLFSGMGSPVLLYRGESHKLVKVSDKQSGAKTINQYSILKELGRGVHGKVKVAMDTADGTYWAIKIVDKHAKKRFQSRFAFSQSLQNRSKSISTSRKPEGSMSSALSTTLEAVNNLQLEKIKREIAILKKISHKNVVALREVIDDPEAAKIYLVLEYMAGGEVEWRTILDNASRPVLSPNQARKVLRDVVCGLEYLHHNGIIHRDIKPANLLWDEAKRNVKISDFGVSVFVDINTSDSSGVRSELAKTAGSPAFFAPELCAVISDDDDGVDDGVFQSESVSSQRDPGGQLTSSAISTDSFPMGTPKRLVESHAFSIDQRDDSGSILIREVRGQTLSKKASNEYYGGIGDRKSLITSGLEKLRIDHLPALEKESTAPMQQFLNDLDFAFDSKSTAVNLSESKGMDHLSEGLIHKISGGSSDFDGITLSREGTSQPVKVENDAVLPGRINSARPEEWGGKTGLELVTDQEHVLNGMEKFLNMYRSKSKGASRADQVMLGNAIAARRKEWIDAGVTPAAAAAMEIGAAIDVWALGVTLFCLVFGRVPFTAATEFELFHVICKSAVEIPACDKMLEDLLLRFLDKNPDTRIRIPEIKMHPWVLHDLETLEQEQWKADKSSFGKPLTVTEEEVSQAVRPVFMVRLRDGLRKLSLSVSKNLGLKQRSKSLSSVFAKEEARAALAEIPPVPPFPKTLPRSIGVTDWKDPPSASLRPHVHGQSPIDSVHRAGIPLLERTEKQKFAWGENNTSGNSWTPSSVTITKEDNIDANVGGDVIEAEHSKQPVASSLAALLSGTERKKPLEDQNLHHTSGGAEPVVEADELSVKQRRFRERMLRMKLEKRSASTSSGSSSSGCVSERSDTQSGDKESHEEKSSANLEKSIPRSDISRMASFSIGGDSGSEDTNPRDSFAAQEEERKKRFEAEYG